MIKLELTTKPAYLITNETRLRDEFIADKTKNVWKHDDIRKSLLEMTHNKCAYSEAEVNSDSSYCEVEHFKPKGKYPECVVEWGNLLPSCKTCNCTKKDWDVVVNPIVDPIHDNPKEHLFIKAGRYYSLDEKGETTIAVVALNCRDHFVTKRIKLAVQIVDSLESELAKLEEPNLRSLVKKKIETSVKANLRMCTSKKCYSAVLSTYVLYEFPLYNKLEQLLKQNKLWDEELEDIKKDMLFCAMPKP